MSADTAASNSTTPQLRTGGYTVDELRRMPTADFVAVLDSFASQPGIDVDWLSSQLLIAECIERLSQRQPLAADAGGQK